MREASPLVIWPDIIGKMISCVKFVFVFVCVCFSLMFYKSELRNQVLYMNSDALLFKYPTYLSYPSHIHILLLLLLPPSNCI